MEANTLHISVIIPLYNAEAYIAKALESCLQFPEVKEILVIDDGFKDQAKSIVLKYAENHSEIKIFEHPGNINKGAGATRNLGLENATQPFIAFLDADDYYLPNRFDVEREIFKNPNIDGVYGATGVEFYNEIGKENFIAKFKIENEEDAYNYLTTVKEIIEPSKLFYHLWGIKEEFLGYFTLDSLTIKKTVLDAHSIRFNEKLKLHQDTEFMSKLAFSSNLHTGNYREAITIRGLHDQNRYVAKQEDTKIIQNRRLLYQEAGEWLKTQNANEYIQNYFSSIADLLDFKLSTYRLRKRKYFSYISKYKNFLQRDDYPFDQIHRSLFKNWPIQKLYLSFLEVYRNLTK